MSKIHDFSGGMFAIHVEYKYLSEALETCYHRQSYKKMKWDNISQIDNYDAPFCKQQYMHVSLFKFKPFDQFDPPKLSQILDIYSVVVL